MSIGGKNYCLIENLEPGPNGWQGTPGYSKITEIKQVYPPTEIPGLSRANPCVVTYPEHGLAADTTAIRFTGIAQADWEALNDETFDIIPIDDNSFAIDIDTSVFAADYDADTDPGQIATVPKTQYTYVAAGMQLRYKSVPLSGLYVQAFSPDQSASAVLAATASTVQQDVPNPRDFDFSPIHTDAPGAGRARFAMWPRNHFAYCNGRETLIYAGPEMPPAKCLVSSAPMTDIIENPVDYSAAVINDLRTPGNTARLSASPDEFTALLLPFEGEPGATTTTDKSGYEHDVTVHGDATISNEYKKFGFSSTKLPNSGCWRVTHHAVFNLSTTPFTMDYQLRAGAGTHGMIGQYADSSNYWYIKQKHWGFLLGGAWPIYCVDVYFKAVSSGATIANYRFRYTGKAFEKIYSGWHHFELDRSGQELFGWYDGKPMSRNITTAITDKPMPTFTGGYMEVGACDNYGTKCNGYLDMVRLSAGIARHTEPFFPPQSPYDTGRAVLTLFVTRPIQAVKFYLNEMNAAAATITGRTWSGKQYEALEIADNTNGFSVDEARLDIGDTRAIARPRVLAGNLYYVYQFELSAGSTEIYRITVDAPIQPVRDLWDGIYRPLLRFRYFTNDDAVGSQKWYDATMNVAEETPAGVSSDSAFVAKISGLDTIDIIEFASAEKLCGIRVTMYEREPNYVNFEESAISLYFWNGNEYTLAQGLVDETSEDGATCGKSGHIHWSPTQPGEEYQKTEDNVSLWRYRIKVSSKLTKALNKKVWIDRVQGIPAPRSLNPAYLFPFMFQNRPMLCNLLSTGEGNRVDYAIPYSCEGWNGEDSSFGDGRTSLLIGNQAALTGACEIYNRLGSSIYSFALFFKDHETYLMHGHDHETYKNYPINDKIGCPAPDTIDTHTMTASREADSARSIAACNSRSRSISGEASSGSWNRL